MKLSNIKKAIQELNAEYLLIFYAGFITGVVTVLLIL